MNPSLDCWYVLDHERRPVKATMEEWANWRSRNDHIVKQTWINDRATVSTIFLGLDHSLPHKGPPLLFETAIFADDTDVVKRYASWDDAIAGHDTLVKKLRAKYRERT